MEPQGDIITLFDQEEGNANEIRATYESDSVLSSLKGKPLLSGPFIPYDKDMDGEWIFRCGSSSIWSSIILENNI